MVVNINFAHLSNILSSYLVSVADNGLSVSKPLRLNMAIWWQCSY